MHTSSLLRFAEKGNFSQMRAFAGDVLYTEGMPGTHMYVIKEGEVDIYMVREEKRVVVETLSRGQCFGLTPHLPKGRRINNAAARTYCELYLVDNQSVEPHVQATPELARSVLHTLSDRLSAAHELIATRVNYQPDILIYAQLLYLLGIADIGKQAVVKAEAAGKQALASPLLQDVVMNARIMFAHSDKHIRTCLAKLLNLHLIRIEDEKGTGKRVLFSPRDIVSQARKVTDSTANDADKLSYEYISVDEFAAMVDVERPVLLRKLAGGDFSDDVFTFRKTEIMRLLDEKGRRFFAERKIKTPDEFTDILDIEFADQKTVFAVVSKVDTFQLAKLLSSISEEAVKQKIVASLSRSKREEIESDLKDMKPADPIEVQQIGGAIIKAVKELMTKGA